MSIIFKIFRSSCDAFVDTNCKMPYDDLMCESEFKNLGIIVYSEYSLSKPRFHENKIYYLGHKLIRGICYYVYYYQSTLRESYKEKTEKDYAILRSHYVDWGVHTCLYHKNNASPAV